MGRKGLAWHLLVVTLLVGTVQNFILSPRLTGAAPVARTTAEQFMAQGWSAWQRGAFEEAARAWLAAVPHYEQARQPHAQSAALTQLAHAYQALGQYRKAAQSLASALELAQQAGDRVQVATVLGGLGRLYLVTGPSEAAQNSLQEGIRLAREVGHTALIAAILNDLGNLFASQNKYAEALDAYGESVQVAEQNHDRALAVRALTNAAMASIRQGQYRAARTRLDMALAQMQSEPQSHDKAYSFINIGLIYVSLSASLSADETSLTLRAAGAFNAAAHIARTINDQRTLSYALGHLGALYEEEQRYNEALQL